MRYVFLVFFLFSNLIAGEAVVLSAANLKFFFSDILKEYCKKYPNDKIRVEYDSSGNFTKQILAGKEYDIFLAANMSYPQKVFDANKAVSKPKTYTTGSIILLLSRHNGLEKKGLSILEDMDIKEITIANKKTAPYGMAAVEALKKAKIYDKVKSKLFYSTNASNIIGDVLWYGHAGILPKSAVNFLPRGYNIRGENWIDIDQKLYRPLKQGFVLSKNGSKNITAKRFIDFLLSDGQKILKQNGYK